MMSLLHYLIRCEMIGLLRCSNKPLVTLVALYLSSSLPLVSK